MWSSLLSECPSTDKDQLCNERTYACAFQPGLEPNLQQYPISCSQHRTPKIQKPTSKTHLRWTMGYEPHKERKANACVCTDGNAKSGAELTTNEATMCASCNEGFTKNTASTACQASMSFSDHATPLCSPTLSPDHCVSVSENGKS